MTDKHHDPVISIQGLKKSFKDHEVLKGIDLEVYKGENLVVLGKSGSGKSVLIKCLVGLEYPDEGEIKVFDQDISQLRYDELNALRVRVGFLFQNAALYDSMTVRENLVFPLRRHKKSMTREKKEAVITEMLENVGLEDSIDQMPSRLSGGQAKRIGLARTLILRPEIMLYDEPTTGLDTATSHEISELMVRMKKKYNISSITITHDMSCAKLTADRIVILKEGIVVAEGSYEELIFMPKEKNYKWKLGLFSVATLVIAIAAIYYIGKQKNKFGSVLHISALFNSVSGLKIGGNVRMGGIDIGTVDGIELATDTSVQVQMIIQRRVQKFIKKDAKAAISSEGLMGDKVVSITAGSPGQQTIVEGDSLSTLKPIETDQIISSLKTSADNAAIITHNLADISSRINNGKGALGKLLKDTGLSTNISATVRNLKQGSEGLKENMEAAKHNFLLRGFFRKKEKEKEKEKKKQEEEAKKQ